MRVLRVASFGIRFAIIGGGSMLVSGLALADSNVAIQTTDPEAVVSIQSETVEQTTITQSEIVSTPSSDVADTDVMPLESTAPMTDVTEPMAVFNMAAAATPVTEVATDGVKPADEIESNLVTAASLVSFQPVASLVVSAIGVTSALPITPSAEHPVTPVQPIGAIGTFLAFFTTVMPARLIDLMMSSASMLSLFVIIALVGLSAVVRRAEVSYGAWLKLGGFVAAGSTALPAPTSLLLVPTSFGYACAPAPYA